MKLFFALIFLIGFFSCKENETPKNQVQNKQKKKEVRLKIIDSTHNNYAKIMSGNELSLLTYHYYSKYSEELHQKADKIDSVVDPNLTDKLVVKLMTEKLNKRYNENLNIRIYSI